MYNFTMTFMYIILRSIPYILSIAGGILVFNTSQDYLHDPVWVELMDNVAASLLSIPLVFLFYDYSNFLINRRVHKYQRIAVINTIDDYLFKILNQIKNIAKFERIEIPMGELTLNYRKLDLSPRYFRVIKKQLNLLEDILYKSNKIEALEAQHTQILSFVTQELNQTLNSYQYHNSSKEIARNIETTLAMIDDWFYATGYTTRKKAKYRRP